jgi:nucleotide-binding universal stress UspA family protein
MVYFAYDGSVNGDWVSHYAIHLASHHDLRILNLLHIRDGSIAMHLLSAKLQQIESECVQARVDLRRHLLPLQGSVLESLAAAVTSGPDSCLVCGTRARSGNRGIISGTISEQILRAGRCNVLAIRVVQPGLLGLPRRFLIPLAGHARMLTLALPMLALFAPDMESLHLLLIKKVGKWQYRHLSVQKMDRLLHEGGEYIRQAEEQLIRAPVFSAIRLDAHVMVSDDIPKEIVIAANRMKSKLIVMGASERNLRERFFYGNPIEQVLRETPCDVAVFRGAQ